MSNSLAIAATTRTLLSLLADVAPTVTALPPDQARDDAGDEQLNLFLYQTEVSGAWRNADPTRPVRPGETRLPPLALTLRYLVTAFGLEEARAHEVLGTAMSILHDHPVLSADEIRDANAADLPAADLHLQTERIRIAPLPLSTDDMFTLWSGFQTNYRLSAAYEVSVVLVDVQGDRPRPSHLVDGARLETLAPRLEPRAAWDQLVLPDNELALLRSIADQVRHRGRVHEEWGFAKRMNRGPGISVLFAGESGTGKTIAAEVLARELSLDLHRIDLSRAVSGYIGETEKNLRRLFDAADRGGAILFFDEADALFGKRSEIRDAHDRYANNEIGYLLQRMEAYPGLSILATNTKSALDRAFIRRLRFVVDFPLPTPPDRARMWGDAFPPDAPVGELDFDRLARIELTGSGIHNAALNAAFLAAAAGHAIGMREVLDAARRELRKEDQPVDEADFGVEEPPA